MSSRSRSQLRLDTLLYCVFEWSMSLSADVFSIKMMISAMIHHLLRPAAGQDRYSFLGATNSHIIIIADVAALPPREKRLTDSDSFVTALLLLLLPLPIAQHRKQKQQKECF